jgi:hypothetical protein
MAEEVYTNSGSFVPTSYVWDVARLYEVDINSDEFKELLVRLYQNLNIIALSLNTRDAGYYNTSEFVNGQVFFPNPLLNSSTPETPEFRQVFRKVINFGALPNTTTKSVPHGITITPTTTFTRIYGAASNPTSNVYLPLPFASPTLADNIELYVDLTNVVVITANNESLFTTTYIILEYLQS